MSFQHSVMLFMLFSFFYVFAFFKYILKRDNLWSNEKVLKEVMNSNVFNEAELVRLISRTIFDNFLKHVVHFFASAAAMVMLQMMLFPISRSGFLKIDILLGIQILILVMIAVLGIRNQRKQLEQLFSKDKVKQILNNKQTIPSRVSLKEEFPVPKFFYVFLLVQWLAFLMAVWMSFNKVFLTGAAVFVTSSLALYFLDRIPFNYQFANQIDPFRRILGNVKRKSTWMLSLMSVLAYLTLWLAGSYIGG